MNSEFNDPHSTWGVYRGGSLGFGSNIRVFYVIRSHHCTTFRSCGTATLCVAHCVRLQHALRPCAGLSEALSGLDTIHNSHLKLPKGADRPCNSLTVSLTAAACMRGTRPLFSGEGPISSRKSGGREKGQKSVWGLLGSSIQANVHSGSSSSILLVRFGCEITVLRERRGLT